MHSLAASPSATHATPPPAVFCAHGPALLAARQRVAGGDITLRPALAKLLADADHALSAGPFSVTQKTSAPPSGDKRDYMSQGPYWWPDPSKPDGLPYRQRDGEVNPETLSSALDRVANDRMTDAVITLALAYYHTGDERYAARAATLLRTWFLDEKTAMNPHLDFGQAIPGRTQGRDIGIIETRNWVYLLDASVLLGSSKAWPATEQQRLLRWFDTYLTWLTTSPLGKGESGQSNNHGTFYDVQVAGFALHTGKPELARATIIAAGEKRLLAQVAPDGSQPREIARTRSFFYSVMNLRALCLLASFGDHVGVDLWRVPANGQPRIRAAIDFLTPYADSARVWPHKQVVIASRDILIPVLQLATRIYEPTPYTQALQLLPAESVAADRSQLGFPLPETRRDD